MTEARQGLQRLRHIVTTLRGPEGCPWDREQTLQSMREFLVEETYEVLEAIDNDDLTSVREEVGDLLFNVLLVAQIAAEKAELTIDDIADGISNKLVRRHPHVFGEERATVGTSTDEIVARWDEIKRAERPERPFMDSIPKGLPALTRARRLTDRAARVGFEWPAIDGVWDKIAEEEAELQEAIGLGAPQEIADEYGDVLFAWVNLGRFLGVDPEDALHSTSGRFTARFNYIESRLRAQGRSLDDATLEEMDAIWREAKVALRKEP